MSSRLLINQSCSCVCGKTSFAVSGVPITRFFCHCLTCQSVFRQPYADVTAIRASAVNVTEQHGINFRQYQSGQAVSRGTCSACNQPVVGFLSLGPFPKVAFIASQNFADPAELPKPVKHVFYHRRLGDASDVLPKVDGHWRSKLALVWLLIGGLAT